MALPSALSSLSQSLLLLLSLLLGKQLMIGAAAPTHGAPQRSPVRPGPTDGCSPHEYWSAGRCCLPCPVGQHVREPCTRPHTRGQCEKCDRGTYTASPNGLESCLPCGTCSENQDEVVKCTATSNQVCRCRPGHFYKVPGNEEFCMRCSKCPEGTAVLQPCNSTADTVCGPPRQGGRHRLCLIGTFLCFLFAVIIICLCIKKPKDGGLQPGCSGLPRGTRDRGESLGPESSVCSGSSHGTREADPPGPTTEDHSLSACSLDVAPEAPTPPSIPESPAGVGGPQAAAVMDATPCEEHCTPRSGGDPARGEATWAGPAHRRGAAAPTLEPGGT